MTLLDEVKDALRWHARRKGIRLDEWFTQQVHERVRGHRLGKLAPGWASVRLEDEQVRVLDGRWPLERLQEFPRWHAKDEPKRADPPVVVFRGWGVQCLIDGQTRVNLWGKTTNVGPHRVLVVEPRLHLAEPFPGKA